MPTTPRPAYIWDANSNDWAPLAGTVDTGQSYNFSAVQNFNAGLTSSIINGGSVTGKNYLINGGFDVWQRGISSSSGMGYYTADRWYTGGTGGTATVSQEASDLPSGVPVQYGIKWVSSAANSYATLYQAIESQVLKTLLGKQITISGYIKVAGGYSGSMYCVLEYNTLNDALLSSGTNVATGAAGNAVDAASWKRFSFTTTVPSNAAGLRVGLQPDLAQASGVTVRLAGLKLELGTVATSFSTAGSTITEELAACQRYYFSAGFKVGKYANSYQYASNYYFKSTMRTTPSITFTDAVGNVSRMSTYNTSDSRTDNVAPLTVASDPNILVIVPNNNGTGASDIGMSISFTASAEL
jgi:hypothetical protein